MSKRWIARIRNKSAKYKVRHYRGIPPSLGSKPDHRTLLEWPKFLLLEQRGDGFYLFRLSESGGIITDTWHSSLDEAKEQAIFEYEGALGNWIEVPPHIKNIAKFVVGRYP